MAKLLDRPCTFLFVVAVVERFVEKVISSMTLTGEQENQRENIKKKSDVYPFVC